MSYLSGWDDPPDDAALLELGRLTWAAILLEDYTQGLCQQVCRQRRTDSTGEQVRVARAALHVIGDEQLRERTDAWLQRAADALDARHSVLHATPLVFVPLPGTASRGTTSRTTGVAGGGRSNTSCPWRHCAS